MEKLAQARRQLLAQSPFYGTLCLHFNYKPTEDEDTMATDGITVFYNPEFVSGLPIEQLRAVIAHETAHVANGHHFRRGTRDRRTWNIACDHVINLLLKADGYHLPPGALADNAYSGMSAEDVYRRLIEQPEDARDNTPRPYGESDDPGRCGRVIDPPSAPGNQQKARVSAESVTKQLIFEAAMVASRFGALPSGIEQLVTQNRNPTTDWRSALRQFTSTTAKSDYSWIPPSFRLAHLGILVPRLRSDRPYRFVFAIDTSASLSQPDLEALWAECYAIVEDVNPERITVVTCDTQIQQVLEYTPADFPKSINLKGRGGTEFHPVFDTLVRNPDHVDCLIYMTDLDVSRFPAEPPFPVIWAATSDRSAPFGTVIRLDSFS